MVDRAPTRAGRDPRCRGRGSRPVPGIFGNAPSIAFRAAAYLFWHLPVYCYTRHVLNGGFFCAGQPVRKRLRTKQRHVRWVRSVRLGFHRRLRGWLTESVLRMLGVHREEDGISSWSNTGYTTHIRKCELSRGCRQSVDGSSRIWQANLGQHCQ